MSLNRSLLFNREKDIHSGNQKKQSVLTLGCLREKRKAKKTMVVDSSKKKKRKKKEHLLRKREIIQPFINRQAVLNLNPHLQRHKINHMII
jgi:hypothetical protein